MAMVSAQIRIEESVKEQASSLFSKLGMDMSEAINVFLRQCIIQGCLPFNVEPPHFSQATLDAMEEARRISRDPNVRGYASMEELERALEE